MAKKQIKHAISHTQIMNLVENGILDYTFRYHHQKMSDDVFKLFLNSVALDSLDDHSCISDKRIRKLIDWSKISRKKLVRLMTRDLSIIDEVDFEKQKFTMLELEFFLRFHPQYINRLNIDFNSLSPKECLIILNMDKNSYQYINFNTIQFSRLDIQNIVKKFVHEEPIINCLNFSLMDNYIKRFILKKTSKKHLNKIDLSQFSVLDWLDLLQHSPSLFEYCNIDLFLYGDCYYLTKLAQIIPDPKIFDLIQLNCNKISGLGWENLLIIDLKKYGEICNWSKLTNSHINRLKKKIPNIENYPRYSLD